MDKPLAFARHNGWHQLAGRVLAGGFRRQRDRLTARTLGSRGFRAGRAPRLLGLSHMSIGEDFHAGDSLWLEAVVSYAEGAPGTEFYPQLTIGTSARLSDFVHIASLGRVTIGNHLLSGSRVLISDHAHGCYGGPGSSDPAIPPAQRPLHLPAPVRIGDNVWLGDGVAVLAGAEIGDGCIIGANSVVTGPIPAGTVAAGAPARVLRRWHAELGDWVKVNGPDPPLR